jgi:nitrous oxide reductase accessory protein NosL
VAAAETHSVWVTDLEQGDGWLRAEDAAFLRSPALRTPMGGGLAAFASAADAGAAAADLGGVVLTWTEVLAQQPAAGGADAGHDDHAGHGTRGGEVADGGGHSAAH